MVDRLTLKRGSEGKLVGNLCNRSVVQGVVITVAVPEVVVHEINVAADPGDVVNPEIDIRHSVVVIPLNIGSGGQPC